MWRKRYFVPWVERLSGSGPWGSTYHRLQVVETAWAKALQFHSEWVLPSSLEAVGVEVVLQILKGNHHSHFHRTAKFWLWMNFSKPGIGGGGGGGGGMGPLAFPWGWGTAGLLLGLLLKLGGGGRAGPLFWLCPPWLTFGLWNWWAGDLSGTLEEVVLIGGGGGGTFWLYPGTGGTGRDGGGGGAGVFWPGTWNSFTWI